MKALSTINIPSLSRDEDISIPLRGRECNISTTKYYSQNDQFKLMGLKALQDAKQAQNLTQQINLLNEDKIKLELQLMVLKSV